MSDQDGLNVRSGFVMPEGAGAIAIQRLAKVTAELSAAETMTDVVAAAVTHSALAIGASVTTLMLVRDDRIELVAGEGLQPGVEIRWESFGLDDVNPASEAARTGEVVALGGVAQVEEQYPVLRGQVPTGRSLLCLPVGGGRPALGVVGLTFEGGYLPGPREFDLLLTFAGTCGQTVGRIQASERAREREAQLSFLAEASAELVRSLDYRRTLTNVAQLMVPDLADWCAVDIVQDGVAATLAVAHADPDKVAWAWELQEKYPFDADSPSGSPNVIRTGVSEIYPEVTDEMLMAGARDAEHLRLTRELNLRSALVVPLTARGKTLGALSLIRVDSARPFGSNDLALAEDVGRRAGLAIDNARLFEQTQNVALQLQRAVLPAELAEMPGWEVAAHYAPDDHVGVGGDFYDAIPLPDGRLAVAIGDVMGHGVQAAAAMAQLRSAVRAYIATDPEPCAVVTRLDDLYTLLGTTELSTLVYGMLDPVAGTFSFVNAGHYPPLLATPGRPAVLAPTPPRLPLGAGGDQRVIATVDVDTQDVLLLYTDGLIERRGEILDVGQGRLIDAAEALHVVPLRVGLADLVAQIRGSDHDDVTAFAVRRKP